jgi:predicted metal-dependent peptidase
MQHPVFKEALSILLNTNEMKLFSISIYKFDIKIIDNVSTEYDGIMTANVSIRNGKVLLQIYKTFIEKFNAKQLVYVLLHEIFHILYNHITLTTNDDNRFIANLAQDHVINRALNIDIGNKNLTKIETPEGLFIIEPLLDKELTWRQVYEYLLTNSKTTTMSFNLEQDSGDSDNDSDSQSNSNSTITITKTVIEPNGIGNTEEKDKITIYNVPDIIPNQNSSDNQTSKEVTEEMKAEMRALKEILKNRKTRGLHAGQIYEMLEELLKVTIPWTRLVEKAIASKMVQSDEMRSWKNINKRYRHMNITLPSIDYEQKPATLIIARDTSASISKNDLKKFGTITLQSATYFEIIRIIDHDISIQSDIILESNEVQISDLTRKFYGRGGTSHSEVFDKIEESYKNGDEISLVILLTDFESDIEYIWDKYTWVNFIPIVTILTEERNIPKYIDENPIVIKD